MDSRQPLVLLVPAAAALAAQLVLTVAEEELVAFNTTREVVDLLETGQVEQLIQMGADYRSRTVARGATATAHQPLSVALEEEVEAPPATAAAVVVIRAEEQPERSRVAAVETAPRAAEVHFTQEAHS
jgi:hypothetical protein